MSIASAQIQDILSVVSSSTVESTNEIISNSGAQLYDQIITILADTANTSSIISQLTYLSPEIIQAAIANEMANVTALITEIIVNTCNGMSTIIDQSSSGKQKNEISIFEAFKAEILAAIANRVSKLLLDVNVLIKNDTNSIRIM
ncbi:hypothetical protein EDEG_03967 [Edhazardia aedis USNM 41457]|uniref:Uncharacterized protein n=1 Tax=Edhazardia aedis (strain USNM 41457) TaxID=1003232 RepID=J8ZNY9_EDHAE|nr:hypothetical protein EDEG_03967 [Edhazardia aedis USNM 41457]|eukprot:EJW01413.1 hypothetical protein EDEG_03967 [Edhazardia aedis USNM 41457]